MFHVVALPDSGVDGRGCYKLVSELSSGIARPVGGWGCYIFSSLSLLIDSSFHAKLEM
jgi:hypothetical protein